MLTLTLGASGTGWVPEHWPVGVDAHFALNSLHL